jgi:putative transposase
MLLAKKIRLEITEPDAAALEFMQGKCRGLYNWWVMRLRNGERWNWQDAKKTLAESRQFDPELDQVYGKLLAEVYFRLHGAMRGFWRRCAAGEKPGFPRVRPRHLFFTLCYPAMYIKVEGNTVLLPTGGKSERKKRFPTITAKLTEPAPPGYKEVAISRDVRGHYYASFVYDTQEAAQKQSGIVAFDLGLKTLATGYNGQGRFYHIGGFKGYQWYNKQLDKIRSKRDRCKKKSRRYIHLSQVYKRVSEKKRNKRKDCLHKASHLISHRLVESTVVIGDLSQRQMVTKEHTEHQKALHQAVYNDWGLYQLVQMLTYTNVFACQEVSPSGQGNDPLAVGYLRQVGSHPQPLQVLAHKGSTRGPKGAPHPPLRPPQEEFARHGFDFGLPICHLAGQDMPDDHQELAGHGHNRFALANAPRQALEDLAPVGGVFHRHPGGFNQHRAQFPASFFGNGARPVCVARGMNAGAQPAVAHQLLGRGKAADVADGRQHRHGSHHTDAWQLDQQRCLRRPRSAGGQAQQFSVDLTYQGIDLIEQRPTLPDLKAVSGRQGQALPPGPFLLGKGRSRGRGQVMSLQEALQLIANPRALSPQALALGKPRAQVPHRGRWHPDGRNQVSRQKFRQMQRIAGVGLDPAGGNPLHLAGMGQGLKLIVERPGIARGFQHDHISRGQVGLCPAHKFAERDPARAQHDLLFFIDACHRDRLPMDIQTHKTGCPTRKRSLHQAPPLHHKIRKTTGRVVVRQVVSIHQCELNVASVRPVKGVGRATKQSCGLVVPVGESVGPDATRPCVRPRRLDATKDSRRARPVQHHLNKCVLAGKTLDYVDERDSSKMCSRCGHQQPMPLWKRTYRCENCGLVRDRDENSAVNHYQRFLARLGPHTGDPVRCAAVFTATEYV